jgi:hypothetical protein
VKWIVILACLAACEDDSSMPEFNPCADGQSGYLCTESTLYYCDNGEIRGTKACVQCIGNFCDDGHDPLCPDLDSVAGIDPGYCDGDTRVRCIEQRSLSREACGVGECYTSGGYTLCTGTFTANAAVCDATGVYFRCDGQITRRCVGSYMTLGDDCAALGKTCDPARGLCSS